MQPPQNPSDLPSSSGYAPPAPHAQAPYSQAPLAPPQAPRGKVSLDVVGEAWRLLSPNLGNWLVAMVIYIGVKVGVGIFSNLLQSLGRSLGGGNSLPAIAVVLTLLTQVISWLSTQLLLGGLAKLAITTVRSGRADVNEMWSVSKVLVKLALSSLLQGVFYVVASIPGLALLGTRVFVPLYAAGFFNPRVWATGKPPVIPPSVVTHLASGISLSALVLVLFTLPLSALFFLATSLIVDRGLGPWEAISQSVGAMKRHFGSALLLMIVLGLVNGLGALACCVGLLFSIPLCQIAVALVYRDLFGLGSAPETTVYAPPPIANPNF